MPLHPSAFATIPHNYIHHDSLDLHVRSTIFRFLQLIISSSLELHISHNLAVNPARPPATTDDGISFDKAAGLKRFHSHSHQLHTFSHNAGWEGGLSKSRAVLFLIKIATTEIARETSTLPPTKNNASLCVSHLCALFVTTILQ